MSLGFGQLLAILSAMHADVAQKVVQARLKYFQQLQPPFPSSAHLRDESNTRASYSAEHLMMLALAIELLAVGIPPLQSATLVRSAWEAAAAELAARWTDDQSGAASFALAIPEGLEARRGAGGRLEIGGEATLRAWWSNADPAARRVTVVDLSKVVEALKSAVRETHVPHQAHLVCGLISEWAADHASSRISQET